MFEIAKVYIRSIIGTLTIGAVVAYLQVTEPEVLLGLFGAVVAMVMLDKGQEVS